MLVSCILVSHNKPNYCHQAIASLLQQTHQAWECLLVDSGILYDQGYFDRYAIDKRITVIRSTETDETRQEKAMAPWCFNECFRYNRVHGDLVMYLCDDDILYPNAFDTFVNYVKYHPETMAMYASQDISVVYPSGENKILQERIAIEKAGKYCKGIVLDGQIDYLQLCHRRSLLDQMSGTEWWPEGKDTEMHADGIFMEKCGVLTTIYPINIKVSQNRRTPDSLNTTTEQFLLLLQAQKNGRRRPFFMRVLRRLYAIFIKTLRVE